MADGGDVACAWGEVCCEECCPRLPQRLQLFLCCVVIPLLIVLVVLLILYVNPKNPSFSVEKFYVSAFNKTANNATTNTIYFDIKLKNQNEAIGLYYDDPVNLTFSFIPKETNSKITWEYSVPKFYQGNGQSRRLRDQIKPQGPDMDMPVLNKTVVAEHAQVPPPGALMAGLEPLLYFKVDFVTKVRFKLIRNHHGKKLVVSADVPVVANTGEKFAKNGIKASIATGIGGGGARAMAFALSAAICLI